MQTTYFNKQLLGAKAKISKSSLLFSSLGMTALIMVFSVSPPPIDAFAGVPVPTHGRKWVHTDVLSLKKMKLWIFLKRISAMISSQNRRFARRTGMRSVPFAASALWCSKEDTQEVSLVVIGPDTATLRNRTEQVIIAQGCCVWTGWLWCCRAELVVQ